MPRARPASGILATTAFVAALMTLTSCDPSLLTKSSGPVCAEPTCAMTAIATAAGAARERLLIAASRRAGGSAKAIERFPNWHIAGDLRDLFRPLHPVGLDRHDVDRLPKLVIPRPK